MLNIDTSKLLDRSMSRRQFLRNVGVGVVALTGLTAAIRAISQANISDAPGHVHNQSANGVTAYGYGGSVYGGTKPQA